MVLSWSFFFVFAAFSTAQSLAAPLLGDLGLICLCLIYTFFTLGGVVAPYIVRRIGTVTALWTAAVTYALFVCAFVYQMTPLLMITAALNGLLGNVLWTAHGMMMTSITTDENKGKFMSLFFGIMGLHLIPGNIASHYLLDPGDEDSADGNGTTTTTAAPPDPLKDMAVGWSDEYGALFLALTVVGATGVLMLMLLFQPPDPRFGSVVPEDGRPLGVQVRATLGLLCSRRLGCLAPLFITTGVHLVMWASWFPRQMYKTYIGLVIPVFGGAVLVAGLVVGSFLDRYGYLAGMSVAGMCSVLAFVLTAAGNAALTEHCETHAPDKAMPCSDFGDYGMFYGAAFFYGLADVTMQSLCGAICTKDFATTGNTADAFAIKWALFGLGAMVCFLLSLPLSIEGGKTASEQQLRIEMILTAASEVAAFVGLFCFTRIQDDGLPGSAKLDGPTKVSDGTEAGGAAVIATLGFECCDQVKQVSTV